MRVSRRSFAAAILFASLTLAIPMPGRAQDFAAPAGVGQSAAVRENAVQTTLSFGMSSRDGSGVSEQEWADFLDEVVTPRFPDGFTVLTGYGQWRDDGSQKIVAEASKLLILTHADNRATARKIDEIKSAYIKRFRQDAVFHTRVAIQIVP
jgi:hypothetical protein